MKVKMKISCTLALLGFVLAIQATPPNIDVNENLVITLPRGKIKGHVLPTLSGGYYYGFEEIPYATPPVGELRFKEPMPAKSWSGILDTTKKTKICPQAQVAEKSTENEDCLYLNVYTPEISRNASKLLPVLVYIYGGMFRSGDTSDYDFQLLVEENIVLVSFNYRTGALGFLSTEDGVIPGNLGLKDQLLALEWVQENIHLFNGDPTKVTIGGHSSGAYSSSAHMLSKKSKGLFRSAIVQSGTIINHTGIQKFSRILAYKLGNKFDKDFTPRNSSQDLLRLLRSLPVKDLMRAKIELPSFAITEIIYNRKYIHNYWKPTLEDPLDKNSFLFGHLHDDIRDGNFNKVPILIGITSEESIGTNTDLAATHDADIISILDKNVNVKQENKIKYAQELKSLYTNTSFQENTARLKRYYSDQELSEPIIRFADLASEYVDVYFYQFSYAGDLGKAASKIYNIEGLGKVGHCGELPYLYFYRTKPSRNFPPCDLLTQTRLVHLWSNFIKYQNPTVTREELLQNVEWPKLKKDNLLYLDIDVNITVKIDPRYYRQHRTLMEKYFEHPLDTCC